MSWARVAAGPSVSAPRPVVPSISAVPVQPVQPVQPKVSAEAAIYMQSASYAMGVCRNPREGMQERHKANRHVREEFGLVTRKDGNIFGEEEDDGLDTITKEMLASSLDEKSSPDVDAMVWGNSDSSESQADEPATPQAADVAYDIYDAPEGAYDEEAPASNSRKRAKAQRQAELRREQEENERPVRVFGGPRRGRGGQ
ncbi:hypothetical protein PMZ80_000347 [Knufia obscura]|uniref:Uncharacterized protein n=1 Tax=Knufia obscura TaxID=1635080 RepID=A0ABR0S049_9EURO|nr:hypothetical protein PMZ80_000347 [Knufia obscura]